jgi:hypothetical protein
VRSIRLTALLAILVLGAPGMAAAECREQQACFDDYNSETDALARHQCQSGSHDEMLACRDRVYAERRLGAIAACEAKRCDSVTVIPRHSMLYEMTRDSSNDLDICLQHHDAAFCASLTRGNLEP